VFSRGFLLPFLFPFWLVDALTAANARIAALEAELNASREAWEGANVAKVAAEKATKSATPIVGLRIGEIGRQMNSKVKLVEIGVCRK
jgi:hypothetical protein